MCVWKVVFNKDCQVEILARATRYVQCGECHVTSAPVPESQETTNDALEKLSYSWPI